MGGASANFGVPSGRMGEQGGLRTGWLAAFGTEGYEGEPPLLEELGVNFEHIKVKVCLSLPLNPTYPKHGSYRLLFTNHRIGSHGSRPSQSSTPSAASTNT